MTPRATAIHGSAPESNGLRRKLSLLRRHPRWAIAEAAGRLRTRFAPRTGKRPGGIGPIRFEFDFDLGPGVRKMHAGAYEIEIVALLRDLLRPGDTFVDVGANIGYLSCVAAGSVGPAGHVISFEPAPGCFRHLQATRAANPDYRWDVYSVGLGAEPGTAELAVSNVNIGWNTLVAGQIPANLLAETVRVEVRRLDDCLEEAGVERVRLLKVDVEGYEGAVPKNQPTLVLPK
jgi:FkbM family methyltransferase